MSATTHQQQHATRCAHMLQFLVFVKQCDITNVDALLAATLCYTGHKAWAFGLGLERLAMVLFDIPDIRCVKGQ
jgi:tRNA synthetases class II core domain (F)